MTALTHHALPPGDEDASPFDLLSSIAHADFIRLPATATAGETLQRFAALRDTPELGHPVEQSPDHVCVVDGEGRFLGLVSLRSCLSAPPETDVMRMLITGVECAELDWSAEEGAAALAEAGTDCLPILDGERHPVAIVTAHDMTRYLVAEIERDTNRSVGVMGDETKDDYLDLSIWSDFRRRMPWILGLAVMGLAAGYVVHVYEDALDALVILALYMPMVADTGGNVGTQSASLVTRALSFGEIEARDALRIIWRETRVAVLMAATLFTFAFLKVVLISNAGDVPGGLTLVGAATAISVALAAQVISATLIGAVLPLGAVALRQDPAVIAGPALTTIVDLTGLILYFGITTHMLGIT